MTEHAITADWTSPTSIFIGKGRARNLVQLLQKQGCKTVLLIIDKGTENAPALKKLIKSFDKSPLSFGVFLLHTRYVNSDTLSLAQRIFKSGAFDCLAAIGGTGAIDLAKLVPLNSLPRNIITDDGATKKQIPVITLPVGCTNGTEVSDSAFLAASEGAGQFIIDKRLRPDFVILDPSLLPEDNKPQIAATAMDTLAHALNIWCMDHFDPAGKAMAQEAIRLVFDNLPIALNEQDDANARIKLMSAAIIARLKPGSGLSTTAALAHALSLLYDIDYGTACGILLPHTLIEKTPLTQPHLEALANALPIRGGVNGLLQTLLKLRRKAGIPAKLMSLTKDDKLKTKDKIQVETYAASYPQFSPGLITQKAMGRVLDAAIRGKMNRDNKKGG